MSKLTTAERVKVGKLLAMTTSTHPGERDAAMLAANRIIQAHGLSWPEVLTSQPAPQTPASQATTRATGHEATARWALGYVRLLSDYDGLFLASIRRKQHLTIKQWRHLARIVAHLQAAGAAGGHA